ncbi:hypothetical protein G6F57_013533 [Rhizopus arrhizus]|nr:hypothetical protein G6F57_013533 [Rhizopus arrhizus]
MIPSLIHPVTKVLCSSRVDMLDAASIFYSDLCSPDPVDPDAIESLLSALPSSLRLSSTDQNALTSPIVFDDILEGVSRCPSRSSPGTDGLPYELLRLIITHPACRDITLAVYNDSLSHGIFPPSWLETSVSLIPKKGSLSDLKNWHPISLINTDAKVFTRILSARLISCVDDLIIPYQSGFPRDRFIADNGLLMKLIKKKHMIESILIIYNKFLLILVSLPRLFKVFLVYFLALNCAST